jgi:hypothetical protein
LVPESFTGHGPICSFGAPAWESLQRLVRQLFLDLKDSLLRWFPDKKERGNALQLPSSDFHKNAGAFIYGFQEMQALFYRQRYLRRSKNGFHRFTEWGSGLDDIMAGTQQKFETIKTCS